MLHAGRSRNSSKDTQTTSHSRFSCTTSRISTTTRAMSSQPRAKSTRSTLRAHFGNAQSQSSRLKITTISTKQCRTTDKTRCTTFTLTQKERRNTRLCSMFRRLRLLICTTRIIRAESSSMSSAFSSPTTTASFFLPICASFAA